MSPKQLLLTAVTLVSGLALSCFSAGSSATTQKVKCLQLLQNHVYLGDVKVLLTPSAVRLEGLGKFRVVLIARGPKWQVAAIRPDDKSVFTQSLDEFCDQGLYSNIILPQRPNMMMPGTQRMKQKAFGFPVQQARYPTMMLTYLEDTGYTHPNEAKFLHSAYKVPTDGRIPISFAQTLEGKDWMTNMNMKGHERMFLRTDSISLANVSANLFDVPKNLKPVNSMIRIMSGDVHKYDQSGLDDLIKE